MVIYQSGPVAIAEELGQRLKQARLRADLTQNQVAAQAGVSRKVVINAEKGKVQLVSLIAIMQALQLDDAFNSLLPPDTLSPRQLYKLQGKQRQRASGTTRTLYTIGEAQGDEASDEW